MTYPQNQGPSYGEPYGQQPPVVSGPPAQYGQPPHSAPPAGYGYPPQRQPKKKRKWPWIVGGILIVMILGCVGAFSLLGFGAKKAADTLNDNQTGKNAAAGQMGVPGRDGKFEFTVMTMSCGHKSVGSDYDKNTAQGAYCLVTVKVRNIGKEAQSFDGSSQKAYDAKGTQYSNATDAEFAVNDNNQTLWEQINPGNQVTGVLVYDVPAGTKLTSIELHDSFLSGGVKVPLK